MSSNSTALCNILHSEAVSVLRERRKRFRKLIAVMWFGSWRRMTAVAWRASSRTFESAVSATGSCIPWQSVKEKKIERAVRKQVIRRDLGTPTEECA